MRPVQCPHANVLKLMQGTRLSARKATEGQPPDYHCASVYCSKIDEIPVHFCDSFPGYKVHIDCRAMIISFVARTEHASTCCTSLRADFTYGGGVPPPQVNSAFRLLSYAKRVKGCQFVLLCFATGFLQETWIRL